MLPRELSVAIAVSFFWVRSQWALFLLPQSVCCSAQPLRVLITSLSYSLKVWFGKPSPSEMTPRERISIPTNWQAFPNREMQSQSPLCVFKTMGPSSDHAISAGLSRQEPQLRRQTELCRQTLPQANKQTKTRMRAFPPETAQNLWQLAPSSLIFPSVLSLGYIHYNLRFSNPVSSWRDVLCQMEEFSRHLNSQPLHQHMKLSLSGEASVHHWEMPETLCARKLSGYIGPVTDGGHHSHLQAFSFRTTNTTSPVCFGNQHFRQRRN